MSKKGFILIVISFLLLNTTKSAFCKFPNKGLIFGSNATMLILNGKGELTNRDFDFTYPFIAKEDPNKNGFGWDNKNLLGINTMIGYKISPRLLIVSNYNYYFNKTAEESYFDITDAFTEYSQESIQLLTHFFPSTKFGLFLVTGIEYVWVKTKGSATLASFRYDFEGNDNAFGFILGGGYELPLPVNNMSLTATTLYSLTKYKGDELWKLDKLSNIDNGRITSSSGGQKLKMETGLGGISFNVGLRYHILNSDIKLYESNSKQENTSNVSLGIATGISKPTSAGSEYWNIGFNGNGSFFFSLSDYVRIGGRIAYNRWGLNEEEVLSELESMSSSDDINGAFSGSIDIIEISPLIRILATKKNNRNLHFFGQIGVGYYMLDNNVEYNYSLDNASVNSKIVLEMDDNKYGLNFGIGTIIDRQPNMSFEISPNYQIVFTEDELTQYFIINLGVIFNIK